MRLRYVASVNPPVEGLTKADCGTEISFLPLDKIWADDRFDPAETIEFGGDVQSYNPVAEGDLLVPKVSPTFGHGRVALAEGLVNGRALATSEVFVVRARTRDDARFLKYRLLASDFRQEGMASWVGVAGLKRVSGAFLRDVRIVPRAWRERGLISALLERESVRIKDLADAAAEITAGARQAFFEQSYLTLCDPKDRETIRLRFLIGSQLNGSWGDDPGVDQVDMACVRVADFDRAALFVQRAPTVRSVPRAVARRIALSTDDLLLEKSGGGTVSPVGFVVRYTGPPSNAICSNFIARLRPAPGVDSTYLTHVFGALYAMRRTEPFVRQVTGIQNLDSSGYLNVVIPRRSYEDQLRLARQCQEQLERVLDFEAKAAGLSGALAEYRDALITEAVTGQLDLKRLSDAQMDESLSAVGEGERPEVLA